MLKGLTVLFCAFIAPVVGWGRDIIDVGAGVVCLDRQTGKMVGSYTPHRMALFDSGSYANPFACSKDGSLVYLGYFEAPQDSQNPWRNEWDRLKPKAICLSLPQLSLMPMAVLDPSWKLPLTALPSDADGGPVKHGDLIVISQPLKGKKTEWALLGTPMGMAYPPFNASPRRIPLERKWTSEDQERIFLGIEHAFVVVDDHSLWSWDVKTGKCLWKFPKEFLPPPVNEIGVDIYPFGQDRYLIAVNHAGIFCVESSTGKIAWHMELSNNYDPPRIIDTGRYLVLAPVLHFEKSDKKP